MELKRELQNNTERNIENREPNNENEVSSKEPTEEPSKSPSAISSDKLTIPEDVQKRMMGFFMQTSIPRKKAGTVKTENHLSEEQSNTETAKEGDR